jgi:hypothetical protein
VTVAVGLAVGVGVTVGVGVGVAVGVGVGVAVGVGVGPGVVEMLIASRKFPMEILPEPVLIARKPSRVQT